MRALPAALAALLVVAALLLAFFNRPQQFGAMPDGLQTCFIDYWEDDDWKEHMLRIEAKDGVLTLRGPYGEATVPARVGLLSSVGVISSKVVSRTPCNP